MRFLSICLKNIFVMFYLQNFYYGRICDKINEKINNTLFLAIL